MKVPIWKFLLIDGGAAFISVPTQVILVATYGEVIVSELKRFKLIVISTCLLLGALYFAYRFFSRKGSKI